MHESPVVLVTGAARRIGAIIARRLHETGYRVVIHYRRSHQKAHALADELNQIRAHSAAVIAADFSEFSAYAALIEKTVAVWGRLDVLVNNASDFFPTPIGLTTETQWQELMDSNLKAPYFLSQAAANYLAAQSGCIINITDIHGERPLKNYSVYSTAKAGLIMLTKALARELAPAVRVNAISPGATLPPEGYDESLVAALREKTLLKRLANPLDIANAVLFLMTQSSMTGQTLTLDSGRSLHQ